MSNAIHRFERLINHLILLHRTACNLDDGLGCTLCTLCRLIRRCGELFRCGSKLLGGLRRLLNQFTQIFDHREQGVVELSDLIVAIHLGRDDGKITLCHLLRRTCHILKRACNRVGNLIEQTANKGEGDEESNDHRPFEVIYISKHLILRDKKDE